uniref:Vomeronasal type-1 receptor n=1 Tax=Erpetoichthys calabaricus TaxID=27687 RepID=A0A8C4SZ84_ERPCA
MDTRTAVEAAGFLLMSIVSIPANLIIICSFLLTADKLLTADTIHCHLALVNLMMAFTRSVPQTLNAFGLRPQLSDVGCKLIFLTFRSSRGLSISFTCLLSTYQAVLVSPATSWLAPLKTKIPQYLLYIIGFLYVLYCTTDISTCIHIVSSFVNNTIPPYTFNLGYCFAPYPSFTAYVGIGLGVMLRDLAFIILMAVMSGYILCLLYQHHKKVKGLRSSERSQPRGRAETRASRAVVTLVVLYVIFFGVDNVIWIYSLTFLRVSPIISNIRVFFSILYSSLCPAVVISTNPKVKARLMRVQVKRTNMNTLSSKV